MRSNHRRLRAATVAACLACVAVGAALPAHAQGASADAAMTDEARRLYDEAKKAKDRGDHPACVAKLRAAWALKRHRQVAGLLGECELRAGQKKEAAEHLAYFLDNAGDATPAALAAVRGLYDEARADIAVVAVRASAEGADRKVDGRALSPEETKVFLTPGEHVFAASKAGAGSGEKKVFVSAGQEREVVIDLAADAGAAAPPPPVTPPYQPPSTPPTERQEGPSLIPGLVMGGVGVVGVGVGITLLVVGGARGSDADAIAAEIARQGGRCDEPTADFETPCATFASLADEQDTFNLAGAISLIGGGLLLAGGAGWTLWAATSDGEPGAATAPRVILTPSLGLETGALRLHGAF